MTLAEKLRFLADRVEDGKPFHIVQDSDQAYTEYCFKDDLLYLKLRENNIPVSGFELNDIREREVKLSHWRFTENEKIILRNLPDEFRWIARDKSDTLFVYTLKPTKANQYWSYDTGDIKNLDFFNHIFQCIQWSDDEPCEFRKYL